MNTNTDVVHDGEDVSGTKEWLLRVWHTVCQALGRCPSYVQQHTPDFSLMSYRVIAAIGTLESGLKKMDDQVAAARLVLGYDALAPQQLASVLKWWESTMLRSEDEYPDMLHGLIPLLRTAILRLKSADSYEVPEMVMWHRVMVSWLQKETDEAILNTLSQKVVVEAGVVYMLRQMLQCGLADNARCIVVRDGLITRANTAEWKCLSAAPYWYTLDSFVERAWDVLSLQDQLPVFAIIGEERSGAGAQQYLQTVVADCHAPSTRYEHLRSLAVASGVSHGIRVAAATEMHKDAGMFLEVVTGVTSN